MPNDSINSDVRKRRFARLFHVGYGNVSYPEIELKRPPVQTWGEVHFDEGVKPAVMIKWWSRSTDLMCNNQTSRNRQ